MSAQHLHFLSHHQENQNHLHKHLVKDITTFCKHNTVTFSFFPISSFSLCFSIMHPTLLECPFLVIVCTFPLQGFCRLRKFNTFTLFLFYPPSSQQDTINPPPQFLKNCHLLSPVSSLLPPNIPQPVPKLT